MTHDADVPNRQLGAGYNSSLCRAVFGGQRGTSPCHSSLQSFTAGIQRGRHRETASWVSWTELCLKITSGRFVPIDDVCQVVKLHDLFFG